MNAVFATIGFILAIAGHQLLWLFAGGAGFVLGYWLTQTQGLAMSGAGGLAVAVTTAVSGIMMIYFLPRFTQALSGGLAAAYLSYYLPQALGWDTSWFIWQIALLSGLLGLVAVLAWRIWATIAITTATGATLFIQNVQITGISSLYLLILLVVIGLTSQFLLDRYIQPGLE